MAWLFKSLLHALWLARVENKLPHPARCDDSHDEGLCLLLQRTADDVLDLADQCILCRGWKSGCFGFPEWHGDTDLMSVAWHTPELAVSDIRAHEHCSTAMFSLS
jgi:hypothetical protein